MPDKYYDVVVIGRSLGALVAAALLARRDFTVLVLGQGRRAPEYGLGGRTLRRRAFTMLAAESPVWKRIIGELAHTQTWRRRTKAVEPMLQVLMPGRRFEVYSEAALFAREVDREFPEVRQLIAELYGDFARVMALADRAFERDAVWPPGSFLERRETGRVASTLPYARAQPHADLLAEFPRSHPYRSIVAESVRFASELATPVPAFAMARLHGAWTRGLVALDGGERELEALLLDRIQANGGVHLLGDRVETLEIRRSAVAGVHIDGDSRPTGAGFVITDLTGEELAALAGGRGISKRAQREWPRIVPAAGRFVVSLIVDKDGVPSSLGQETFVIADRADDGATAPAIHLQRAPSGNPKEVLLVAETWRGDTAPASLGDARAHVLDRLTEHLPFLERHLRLVDSVHDGLPVWCFDSAVSPGMRAPSSPGWPAGPGCGWPAGPGCGRPAGPGVLPTTTPAPVELDRSVLGDSASTRAEPMDRQLDVDPPGYLGIAGEPIRGPIERTLLVGASVLPSLGQEGKLLAACGAARLVTRSDKRRARVRREMWTKIEIS